MTDGVQCMDVVLITNTVQCYSVAEPGSEVRVDTWDLETEVVWGMEVPQRGAEAEPRWASGQKPDIYKQFAAVKCFSTQYSHLIK